MVKDDEAQKSPPFPEGFCRNAFDGTRVPLAQLPDVRPAHEVASS